MNKEDLKKIIVETIQEVDFEDDITMALDNIETWVRNAKRHVSNKQDPQIFYRLMKAIIVKASEIIDDPTVAEGYGSGDPKTDPKAAGNWKVHYPSEKDWKKNKKSLSKVFEISPPNQHEGMEMQAYKSIVMVASKLIQLHSTSNYDEKEEERLHKALQQLVGKLGELEKSEPEHLPPDNPMSHAGNM